MAHGIKTVLIKKNENLECNNNNNNTKNSNCNKVATSRSHLIIDNCCLNVNNMMMNKNQISTHTVVQSPAVNKSLNCGGATMSLTKPATTTSVSGGAKLGSRRIFTPHFKLQVLESYRNDSDCKGNQRATARKYGIHRRQIQKWLQCENNLRSIIANSPQSGKNIIKNISKATTNSSTATSSLTSSSSSSTSTTTAAATILQSRLRVVSTNTVSSQHTNKSETAIKLEKDGDMSTNYSCFPMHALPSFKSDILPSTKCLTSSPSSTTPATATTSMAKYLYVDTNQLENNNNATNDKSPANYYYETPNYSSNYSYYEKSDDLPIDLSCNKPSKHHQLEIAVPTPIYPSQVDMIATTSSSSPSASPPHLTDISNSFMKSTNNPIDLTLHPSGNGSASLAQKRKFSVEDSRNNEKKPIKLFKPYLDENFDEVEEEDDDTKKPSTDDKQKFPIIWSNHSTFYQEQYLGGQPVTNNTDYGYYPYCMYYESSPSNYHTLLPPLLPSQASPVSGYDSSTSSIYSFNDNEHDSRNMNSPLHSSGHYEATSPLSTTSTMPSSPVNHHHDMIVPAGNKVPSPSSSLYDLKFKLFALDCYYKDDSCNDAADKCKLVANKLNINCKVVEKWLRQEKDLRHQQQQQQLQILV